jgi:hypothetical protein
MLPYSRQEFFQPQQFKRKTAIILDVGPFWLPSVPFITDTTIATSNQVHKHAGRQFFKESKEITKKIGLNIIILIFGCWPHVDPLI